MICRLSAQETVALVGVAVAVLTFLAREWHTRAIERKRSQPIVIAHEVDPMQPAGGEWIGSAVLTNDGGGSAFNVRFGITMRGVRYAYRLEADDPLGGNRQRVVSPGTRLPEEGALLLKLTTYELFGAAARGKQDGRLHTSAIYWCRYENSTGATWETRNPVDRSANLDIRRVYFPKIRQALEVRRRRRAEAKWDRQSTKLFGGMRQEAERAQVGEGQSKS
jgi:hypothetical protein